MKNAFNSAKLVIVLISLFLVSCANTNASHDYGNMDKTGLMTKADLISQYPVFAKEFNEFSPDAKDAKNFNLLRGMDIVVFFGVWCHDSQREVPRLLKIIESSGVQLNSLKLVAINMEKEVPAEFQQTFKVKYTPTIFVAKDNQVLAKMVERPKQSITKDLLSQILH